MATTYTDAQKQEAVAIYLDTDLAEAHHRTGIPRPTLRRWLTEAGHNPADHASHAAAKTRAANEAATAKMAERRIALRAKLLTAAEHAVDQVTGAADGNQAKGWAVSAGIVIDKLRLELGEVTDRTEHVAVPDREPDVEDELAKVLELVRPEAA